MSKPSFGLNIGNHAVIRKVGAKQRSDVRCQCFGREEPTGAEDWICPPNHSRLIAESIPRGEFLEVPNANHAVHVEAHEVVIAAIREFLARTLN